MRLCRDEAMHEGVVPSGHLAARCLCGRCRRRQVPIRRGYGEVGGGVAVALRLLPAVEHPVEAVLEVCARSRHHRPPPATAPRGSRLVARRAQGEALGLHRHDAAQTGPAAVSSVAPGISHKHARTSRPSTAASKLSAQGRITPVGPRGACGEPAFAAACRTRVRSGSRRRARRSPRPRSWQEASDRASDVEPGPGRAAPRARRPSRPPPAEPRGRFSSDEVQRRPFAPAERAPHARSEGAPLCPCRRHRPRRRPAASRRESRANASGSEHQTRRKVSCEGTPFGSSRKRESQARLDRPYSAMSSKLSASASTAHTAIASTSISRCRSWGPHVGLPRPPGTPATLARRPRQARHHHAFAGREALEF